MYINFFLKGKNVDRKTGQSKLGSFVEAWINVIIGFGVNFTANLIILPMFGFAALTLRNNLIIGIIYTVISVVRSYVVRRWFNHLITKLSLKIAGA